MINEQCVTFEEIQKYGSTEAVLGSIGDASSSNPLLEVKKPMLNGVA